MGGGTRPLPRSQAHISHRQQALVEEEHDAQDREEDAEAGEADADFCEGEAL